MGRCLADCTASTPTTNECHPLPRDVLQGLQDVIGLSVTHPTWQRTRPDSESDMHTGWAFVKPGDPPLSSHTGEGQLHARVQVQVATTLIKIPNHKRRPGHQPSTAACRWCKCSCSRCRKQSGLYCIHVSPHGAAMSDFAPAVQVKVPSRVMMRASLTVSTTPSL